MHRILTCGAYTVTPTNVESARHLIDDHARGSGLSGRALVYALEAAKATIQICETDEDGRLACMWALLQSPDQRTLLAERPCLGEHVMIDEVHGLLSSQMPLVTLLGQNMLGGRTMPLAPMLYLDVRPPSSAPGARNKTAAFLWFF